jgi:uncharacterized membrane protein YkoI
MRLAAFLTAGLLLAPCFASAQSVVIKEDRPGLLQQAKISGDSALKIALARVPNATMKSGEIEKEHGKVVFSFDLAVAGKPGIDEVQVDAVTGKVVSVEHETPADEAKEAAKDKSKP